MAHEAFLASIVAASAALSTAHSQTPDPRDVLSSARDACSALTTARWRGTFEGIGAMSGRLRSEGAAAFQREDDNALGGRLWGEIAQYRYDAREPWRTVCAYDGEAIRHIDHEARVLYIGDAALRMDRMVLLTPYWTCIIAEMRRPAFFDRAIAAETLVYEGQTYVDDVFCHVVYAEPADGSPVRWAIGVDDGLPRRRETWDAVDGRPGAMIITQHDLEVDVPLNASLFEPDAPEGYDETVYSLRPGAPAPAWEATSASGAPVDLAAHRGNVVVLDFWATWCGPCRGAMQSLQTLHERYAAMDAPVHFIGVNVWERDPGADPEAAFAALGCTYDLLLGTAAMAAAYRVEGLPTLVVIDAEGRIVARDMGASADLAERVQGIIDRQLDRD